MQKRFRQISPIGKKDIFLDKDIIKIRGIGRRRVESIFHLADLQLQPRYKKVHCPALVVIPLSIGFLAFLGLRKGLDADSHLGLLIALISFFLICLSLVSIIKGFSSLDVVQFCDKNGSVVFDLVKNKNQGLEFDEFVNTIYLSIDRAKSNEPKGSGR